MFTFVPPPLPMWPSVSSELLDVERKRGEGGEGERERERWIESWRRERGGEVQR